MRTVAYVALLGAAVGLLVPDAFAQDAASGAKSATSQPLPPVVVSTEEKQPTKPKKAKKAATAAPASAATITTPGQSSGGAAGSSPASGFNADLGPDSVSNPYRVAASSRAHTQTFTKADIDRLHPANVFDLLTHATGVQPSYRGRKHVFNLSIRGDSNFAFILDGVYLPDFIGGRILSSLPVSAIEQIEVVRDSTALTLGPLINFSSASGALNSGFVVIRTRRPEKTEADVRAAVESYGTGSASAYAGTTFDKNGWKGYVAGAGAYKTTDGPDGYNMWGDSGTGLAKLGLGTGGFFTEATVYRDRTSYGFERARAGEVAPPTMQMPMDIANQKWSYDPIDTLFFASNSRLSWDKHNTTLLTISLNEIEQAQVQASYMNNMVTANQESDRMQSVSLRHRFTFADTMLEAGGEYIHWHSPNGELYFPGREREEETSGGYVNAEQRLFGDVLTLDASARIDKHTIIKGIELYDESAPGSMNCSGEMMGMMPMPPMPMTMPCKDIYDRGLPLAKSVSLGASLAVTREVSVSGRYSHVWQGELSGILANGGVALEGERQDKWEAAVTANYVPWFVPTLTYFDTRIDNDKTPAGYMDMGGVYVAQWESTDTHRAGLELIARGVIPGVPGKLMYSAGWTHLTEYEATSSPLDSYNDAAFAHTKPRDLVNVTLTGELGPYFATASLSYVSSYLSNFKAPPVSPMDMMNLVYNPVGDFELIDASIGRHFMLGSWDSTLTFFGRNLLDQDYETYNGYPSIGRTVGAEFAFKY